MELGVKWSKKCYTGGDILKGELVLSTSSGDHFNRVEAVLLGYLGVDWKDREEGMMGKSLIYNYKSRIDIVKRVSILMECNEERGLEAGQPVTVPFDFPLTEGIPPSFDCHGNGVEYVIFFTVKRSGSLSMDKKAEFNIQVQAPIHLKLIRERFVHPINKGAMGKEDSVVASVSMDHSLVIVGQQFEVKLVVDNQQKKPVHALTANFCESIEISFPKHGRQSQRKSLETLAKVTLPISLGPFERKQVSFQLTWPADPQTTADYELPISNPRASISHSLQFSCATLLVAAIPVVVLPSCETAARLFASIPAVIFQRKPGFKRPLWVPDADASACAVCQKKFSFWKRRHHCRACFHVVCQECSTARMRLPNHYLMLEMRRVCSLCALALRQDRLPEAVAAIQDAEWTETVSGSVDSLELSSSSNLPPPSAWLNETGPTADWTNPDTLTSNVKSVVTASSSYAPPKA